MTTSMSRVKADAPSGEYSVAEATVDAMLRAGVHTVFGIGGTHTLPLLGAIERSEGLTFVAARTELGNPPHHHVVIPGLVHGLDRTRSPGQHTVQHRRPR